MNVCGSSGNIGTLWTNVRGSSGWHNIIATPSFFFSWERSLPRTDNYISANQKLTTTYPGSIMML